MLGDQKELTRQSDMVGWWAMQKIAKVTSKRTDRKGQMTQWLRVHAALSKDPSLQHRVQQLTLPFTPDHGDWHPLLVAIDTCTLAYIAIHRHT